MSAPVVTTFEHVSELPLTIEEYSLEGPRARRQPEFTRVTTTYHLRGAGEEGLGEDVTYDPDEQREQLARGPSLPLAGEWTFGEFARHVGELDLFPAGAPDMPAYRLYRRWAVESAGLDLALRQAGRSLGDVLGREHRPVNFVVSLRLGNPPSFEPVRQRLEVYPWLRFKLDGTPDWPGELIEQLVETGAIVSIDFKGAYKGTAVDVDTDPGFYRPDRRGAARRLARGPGPDRPRGRRRARAPPRPHHLGRADPLGGRHRGARLPAQDRQREAVALRLGRGAVRRLRLLRRARDRDLRRRPVRARRGPRADPDLASLFHPEASTTSLRRLRLAEFPPT
jgi:hypothetical protein